MYTIIGDNMKDKLKAKLKKVVIPIFISVLSGAVCGHLVYSIYEDKTDNVLDSNVVYLLQTGAYSSYDNMRANTLGNNYVYYEDDGLYKTIIGITKSEANIEKIKQTYRKEVVVNKYLINDKILCQKIGEYDKKLEATNDEKQIQTLTITMLELYKQGKNIELSKIS